MAPLEESGNSETETLTVLIVSLSVLSCLVLVVVGCTWAWWTKLYNQCLRGKPPTFNDAVWQHDDNRATFEQLDASNLERSYRNSITIDPLPTLSDLNIDPRQSFELRSTKAPGIVPFCEEGSIQNPHDWFHHPYESFSRGNLEYQKIIGKGWFGRLIEAEAKNIVSFPKTKKVLVKQMRDDATDQEQMRFLNECRLYRDSTQGNVLKILGFVVDSLPYIMIFEYWPLGDLKTYLIGKQKCGESSSLLNQGMIVRMAIDITKGLEWMFHAGFVHEDLAARNCLVASTAGKVVIGDYGLSTINHPGDYYKKSNYAIPIRWAAPETMEFMEDSFQPLKVTSTSNIWTFGIILWELFQFGKLPYGDMSDEDVIRKVISTKTYILEPPDFPYLQDNVKDRLYKLMLSCWNSVPENRPSIQYIGEVLSTP